MATSSRPRLKRSLAGLAAAALLACPGVARAAAPDLPGHTPVAAGAARAHTAVSASKLRRGLARKARKAGGIAGVWVKDLDAGKVLYKRLGKRRLTLASNTKLFTTGTAIARFGPSETLDTSAWALGTLDGAGVLHGSLLLQGAGDPTMTSQRLAKLAARVKAAGVRRVTAGLRFDDSIFDRKEGIPQAGVTGGPFLGSLSGLSVNYGFNRHGNLLKDPAVTAAKLFLQALRRRDLRVPGKPKRRRLPSATPDQAQLALVRSPDMAALIAATNQPSDNFMAEMLAKGVGARFSSAGTTAAGIGVIRGFAKSHGAGLRAQNGSGLSVKDRAAPRSVGHFLEAMQDQETDIADAFLDSLSTAGHTGTLVDRMRGTAADGRCHAKTGTLTKVSALSGYCFAPGGRMMVFSILNNRVDIDAAHAAQDKMAALIARYRP
jgi:D-alanyl-D-alanine carboxypeptidase/D-alanyl-D-alanine-endopeptidase (penicillin-binding protein 4)